MGVLGRSASSQTTTGHLQGQHTDLIPVKDTELPSVASKHHNNVTTVLTHSIKLYLQYIYIYIYI